MTSYLDAARRPQRRIPIVLAVLAINGFLLWGFLRLHIYSPPPPDRLVHVTIVPPRK